MAAIHIPNSIAELLELSDRIVSKHLAEGEKSPLKNIDIITFKEKIDHIKDKYCKHLELKEQCDKIKDEVQLALGVHRSQNIITPDTVKFVVVQVRDILKGVNRSYLKELDQWGYATSNHNENIKNTE